MRTSPRRVSQELRHQQLWRRCGKAFCAQLRGTAGEHLNAIQSAEKTKTIQNLRIFDDFSHCFTAKKEVFALNSLLF